MGRRLESKPARRRKEAARPGAAQVLRLRIVARVPVIRRLAPRQMPAPPPARRLSPRRVLQLLRRRPAKPPPPPPIPFVSPILRGVRRPIERTAAVVKVARDVRTPRTRWERLREAARTAIEDPVSTAKWERLMGLGVGLVAGNRSKPKAKPARRGLRGRLQQLQSVLNDHAGPLGRTR